MDTNTQPRQPSGTPVGGQFAGKVNPEPELAIGLEHQRWQRPPYWRTDAIIGYMYKAAMMCPDCMAAAVPEACPPAETVEEALDLLAVEMKLDRYAEETFDSDEFPKIVFRDQISEADTCGECGGAMLERAG